MIVDKNRELNDTKKDLNIFYMWHPADYHSILPHWHESIEFIYVLEGTLFMTCGSTYTEAVTGDFIFVNPYQMHSAYSGRQGVKYYAVKIEPNYYKENTSQEIKKYIEPVISQTCQFETMLKDSEIDSVLTSFIKTFEEKSDAYELALQGYLLVLFSILNRKYRTVKCEQLYNDSTYDYIIKYIAEHCYDKLTTKSLAEQFGFCETHFCRIIKKATGQTLTEYLSVLRLSKAYSLLNATNMSITEIALKSGFTDTNYFARCFKKRYSITPKEVRKKKEENNIYP